MRWWSSTSGRPDGRLEESDKTTGGPPMTGKHTHDEGRERMLRSLPTRGETPAASAGADGPAGLPAALSDKVDGYAVRFAAQLRQGVMAASVAIGLEVLDELMAAEVDELAGPKGKHNPDRSHVRHGTEDGSVTLGGRKVDVRRPRVRTAADDGEARLEVYETARAADLLGEHMVGAMLAGLSTRRYPAALEPVGDETDGRAKATSKSSVSRQFVAATAERLAELTSARLDDERWVIVYIDGFRFGRHLLVAALGVTRDGRKVPLAVEEGSTENATLVRRLLAGLADRGLDATRGLLFVVDGSKALSAAIPAVFGDQALVGRCRLHKERNILDHLPEAQHAWVRRKLRAAWAKPDADDARRDLEALAVALQRKHPGAAASLREGLEETLTVTKLKIGGSLLRTVFSTNPVESMIEIIRAHAANVKRWRDGEMALRWAAAGMVCAQGQFRRVKGYRQLPELARRLEAVTTDEMGNLDLGVTA